MNQTCHERLQWPDNFSMVGYSVSNVSTWTFIIGNTFNIIDFESVHKLDKTGTITTVMTVGI